MLKNRIYELDALRGIASLMVVVFHYTMDRNYSFNIGCLGVDLFFIISGFVISLTIEHSKNWQHFIINRFSRLYPSYWTCVSLTTIAIALAYYFNFLPNNESSLTIRYLENLTMFQFYFNAESIDGSYWTLIIELLFYFFILLFILFNKKHLIEIVGAICLILPFCNRFFIDELLTNEDAFAISDGTPILIYFPLFYSGILFYKMKFSKKTILRWILLIASFLIQIFIFDRLYNNRGFISYQQYVYTLTSFYLIFILFIYNKLSFIVNKVTLWLGSISFVLYLIHQFIGVNILIPLLTDKLHINLWLSITITLILMLFISFMIMKYIEKPSLVLIRKKYLNKVQPSVLN